MSTKDPTFIFDSKYNYTNFRHAISAKAKDERVRVVVACDIANFYDRLNLHRLENSLHAIKGIDHAVVSLMNELLLYWSNRDSYGIPVGSNASRILAEASLINVDKYLHDKQIRFARFVDDYRLFAGDASEAHSWLSVLVERLSHEGLFLNTSKTSIIEAKRVHHDSATEQSAASSDEAGDPEMEKSGLPIIIRGYSGLIPTKFRNISKKEVEKLIKEDLEEIRQSALRNELIDPKHFTKYVRITVANQLWQEFSNASSVLKRFPQFVPYFLDCARKHAKELRDYKETIIKNVEDLLHDSNVLEYLKIYIIRFLTVKDFEKKDVVISCYLNLRRSEGVYLGRAILESVLDIVSREDVLQIKNDFIRADRAEKRQILKILRIHLNSSEFKAFYKNISLNENDDWYQFIQESMKI